MKLFDGYYNIIYGSDPNPELVKVDGCNLTYTGDPDDPEKTRIVRYGKVGKFL